MLCNLSPISSTGPELEFRSPRAKLLWTKWRDVWMLSWERQRLLHEHLMYLKDVERARNFSWDDWRKRVSTAGEGKLDQYKRKYLHLFVLLVVPKAHEPQEVAFDRSVP